MTFIFGLPPGYSEAGRSSFTTTVRFLLMLDDIFIEGAFFFIILHDGFI